MRVPATPLRPACSKDAGECVPQVMVDFMIIEISKAFFNFISLSKLHHVSPLAQSSCNAGDLDLIPGLRRSPGDGNRQPTPVFLSGKSHGQRSLVGDSPWGRKGPDTTQRLNTHIRACNKES